MMVLLEEILKDVRVRLDCLHGHTDTAHERLASDRSVQGDNITISVNVLGHVNLIPKKAKENNSRSFFAVCIAAKYIFFSFSCSVRLGGLERQT